MRMDVTNTQAMSFRQLIVELQAIGFDVEHFHAMERVTLGDGREEEEVFHLNLAFEGDTVIDAAWDGGIHEVHPLDQDPRGWDGLVADTWHER